MSDTPRPSSPPRTAGRSVHGSPGTTTPGRAPERRARAVGWGTSDVLRAAALVTLFVLFLRLLWFANALFFVVFLGVLFGLAVSAAVDRLERFRIPRGLGAAFTALGFLALLAGFGVVMAPTIRAQARDVRARLPQAIDRFEGWLNDRRGGTLGFLVRGLTGEGSGGADTTRESAAAVRSPTDTAAPGAAADTASGGDRPTRTDAEDVSTDEQPGISARERLGEQLGGVSSYLFRFLSSTLAVLSGFALVAFIAVYVGANPDLYHRGLLHLVPHRLRARTGEVLSATATMLRRWLITQLIGMMTIGVVTTVTLLILDVDGAFALGALAGVLEFIPTIGPLLSAVPAVAMGFLDSPEKALYVAIAYVVIQFLESNVLMPLLMHEGVDIPPALSIVFQALMALLFGFLGLLVAVPLLAAVMVPVKMLYVEDVVGDDVIVPGESEDDGDDESDGGTDEPGLARA